MDMPQPSWEAILKEEVVKVQGTVCKERGEDVTENRRRCVEHFLKEREAMATKQTRL